jgi:ATP-dependent OLD family endonuclease
MRLKAVQIQGYRAHEDTTVTLENGLTVVVGRNNTGKTSFVEIIDKFIGNNTNNRLRAADFSAKQTETLVNSLSATEDECLTPAALPTIKLKLKIEYNLKEDEPEALAAITRYITTLDIRCKTLIIECAYKPTDPEQACTALSELKNDNGPINFDTVIKTIDRHCNYKATYSAYSTLENDQEDSEERETQPALEKTANNASRDLTIDQVKRIIATEYIYAQIDLDDTSIDSRHNLSNAFEKFYKEISEDEDIRQNLDTAVENMQAELTSAYSKFFKDALKNIEAITRNTHAGGLNLTVGSELQTGRMINSTTRVRYRDNTTEQVYPESHNGLGYSRLTYTILQILAFKEKRSRRNYETPINLLLIEEPEAHLHPQMQEVFIRLVDGILNSDSQLIITTHSSHILSERKLESLRYFKRDGYRIECKDISFWAKNDLTLKEKAYHTISNYLQLRISDLFFADCAILIEGAAERILLPKAITMCTEDLNRSHYTIIEVGGAYAQHFIPLLDFIEIPSLIITDIDSVNPKKSNSAVQTQRGQNQTTANSTLKNILGRDKVDDLLDLNDDEKTINKHIRICFQSEKDAYPLSDGTRLYARTLEDAVIYANTSVFSDLGPKDHFEEKRIKSLLKKSTTEDEIAVAAYEEIRKSTFDKTTFAIDCTLLDTLTIPDYISAGLRWLSSKTQTPAVTAASEE